MNIDPTKATSAEIFNENKTVIGEWNARVQQGYQLNSLRVFAAKNVAKATDLEEYSWSQCTRVLSPSWNRFVYRFDRHIVINGKLIGKPIQQHPVMGDKYYFISESQISSDFWRGDDKAKEIFNFQPIFFSRRCAELFYKRSFAYHLPFVPEK